MCLHNSEGRRTTRARISPTQSFAALSTLVQRKKAPLPQHSGIRAMGHVDKPLAVPLIAEYRRRPSAETRFAVACALGKFANDPRAVGTLGFRLSFRPTLGKFSKIIRTI